MGRKSVIQNEEVLFEVFDTGEEFFIPCRDRLDAHSKSVSLNNARRRMAESQQKTIKVQKIKIGEVWGVKVSPADKVVIFKLVNNEMVPWNIREGKVAEDSYRMIELMIKDGKSDEDILLLLSDEKEELVKATIKSLRGSND